MQPHLGTECDLARRTSIQAYYHNGTLALIAGGETPTPCYEVQIERSLLTVEPPHFSLVQCRKPDTICTEVVSPYLIHQLFAIGVYRKSVTVAHADGQDSVEVEHISQSDTLLPAEGGKTQGANLIPPSAQSVDNEVEATGYSSAHSYEEAFRNAVRALPEDTGAYPDKLTRVIVTEVGGEYGGYAGFSHMFVRVRRIS